MKRGAGELVPLPGLGGAQGLIFPYLFAALIPIRNQWPKIYVFNLLGVLDVLTLTPLPFAFRKSTMDTIELSSVSVNGNPVQIWSGPAIVIGTKPQKVSLSAKMGRCGSRMNESQETGRNATVFIVRGRDRSIHLCVYQVEKPEPRPLRFFCASAPARVAG
jgi:hypothetical protein